MPSPWNRSEDDTMAGSYHAKGKVTDSSWKYLGAYFVPITVLCQECSNKIKTKDNELPGSTHSDGMRQGDDGSGDGLYDWSGAVF